MGRKKIAITRIQEERNRQVDKEREGRGEGERERERAVNCVVLYMKAVVCVHIDSAVAVYKCTSLNIAKVLLIRMSSLLSITNTHLIMVSIPFTLFTCL